MLTSFHIQNLTQAQTHRACGDRFNDCFGTLQCIFAAAAAKRKEGVMSYDLCNPEIVGVGEKWSIFAATGRHLEV